MIHTTITILLGILVIRFISKTYHLQEQLNDLEMRLYGETDEDCGDIDNIESDIVILSDSVAEDIEKLEGRLDRLEKPIKKIKIK